MQGLRVTFGNKALNYKLNNINKMISVAVTVVVGVVVWSSGAVNNGIWSLLN